MTDLTIHYDVEVELVQHAGGDASIVHAARISGADAVAAGLTFDGSAWAEAKDKGLINALMRERHGTPFEHNSITFRVKAPIFVFREWHRHRVQSYNEQSGRYTTFLPEFYIPATDRPVVNVGTKMKPQFAALPEPEQHEVQAKILKAYQAAWDVYQELLGLEVANEVSRLVLPVGVMSSMYATANLRAWLNFLSLRTSEDNATYQGHPQYEIVAAAKKVEAELTKLFPVAMETFNQHGRVAP